MKRSVLSFSHDLNKSRSEVRDPKTLVSTVQQVSDNLAELLNNPEVTHVRLAAVLVDKDNTVRVVELKRNEESISGSVETFEPESDSPYQPDILDSVISFESGAHYHLQEFRYAVCENSGNEIPKVSEKDNGANGYHETIYRQD